jgi:isopentenyl-diphosphate delta-isomerase
MRTNRFLVRTRYATKVTLETRKLRHVDVCLNYPVEYSTRTTGLEHFDLPYLALPETDLTDIDPGTHFLGKPLAAPLLIGAMTGGAELSATINCHLAEAAEALGLGLMLGSQRVMLERPQTASSFQVRPYAPDILLIGNLGVAQLNKGYGAAELVRAIETVGADALALHTNPLQEALQPEGDTDFRHLSSRFPALLSEVGYPVLLKEVGHGLSGTVAKHVKDAGFAALDVAGAGGTSWAKVEAFVRYGELRHSDLTEWGIPTAQALAEVRVVTPDTPLIASGGIRSGIDIAKALMLGADVTAVARPLLKPATESTGAVIAALESLLFELRVAMHCCGAQSIADLKALQLIRRAG